MKTKVVTSAIIRREDGDILVLRRSATDPSRAGHWDLPGGSQDDSETVEQSLLREVHEEVGLDDLGDIRLVFSASGIDVSSADQQTYNYVFLIYSATSATTSITLSYEHDDFRWVSTQEALQLIEHRGLKPAIARYIEIQ